MSKELKLRLLQVSALVEQVANVYSNNLEDLEAEEVEARNEAQSLAQEADGMYCPANTRGLWEKQNKAEANLDRAMDSRTHLREEVEALRVALRVKEGECTDWHTRCTELSDLLRIATQEYAESKTPYLLARKAADTALLHSIVTSAVLDSVKASKLSQESS